MSFQCSRCQATTSRALISKSTFPVTNGYRHWRSVVSVRVGLKMIVTLQGVVVGLNGGFVHIAQLGANCLNGTGRGDLDNASTATRKPHDRNTGAHEGAAAMETRCIFIAVSGFAAY